jgi:hypothetical protein
LTEVADAFLSVSDAVENLSNNRLVQFLSNVSGLSDGLVGATQRIWHMGDAFREWIGISEASTETTVDLSTVMAANAIQAVESTGKRIALSAAGVDATSTEEDLTEAYDDQIRSLREKIAAEEAARTAVMEGRDSSLAYRNQVADTTAAIAAGTLIQLDSKRTDEEKAQASRDVEAAVYAQADAAVALAEDMAAAAGQTLSNEERTKIYQGELDRLSANLTGPTKVAIDEHSRALNSIPKSITTTVTTKYGSLGSSDYTQPGFGTAPRPGGWDGDVRTPYPAAAGAIVRATPGGSILRVGEAGHDEAIVPLTGPNAPGGMGGNTYNITINDATDPDRVVQAIRQFVRRNGPVQGIT